MVQVRGNGIRAKARTNPGDEKLAPKARVKTPEKKNVLRRVLRKTTFGTKATIDPSTTLCGRPYGKKKCLQIQSRPQTAKHDCKNCPARITAAERLAKIEEDKKAVLKKHGLTEIGGDTQQKTDTILVAPKTEEAKNPVPEMVTSGIGLPSGLPLDANITTE